MRCGVRVLWHSRGAAQGGGAGEAEHREDQQSRALEIVGDGRGGRETALGLVQPAEIEQGEAEAGQGHHLVEGAAALGGGTSGGEKRRSVLDMLNNAPAKRQA